ncbi:conjugative transfer system coupling protein TraD [Marinobacter sp.]|uniref:conjugative transfer system coupling protein TraD n=1 Tax=Marinobacter sp. TaxID=50741 RepID=UPI00260667CE|nr:conjugative transfer system coupling protein TraD [Marinobacter sp.]
MSMEYDAHGYEMSWRPNYEFRAVIGWGVAIVAAVAVKFAAGMPSEPLYIMIGICTLMGLARARDAFHLHRTHKSLRGKSLNIVELSEVVKQIEGKSDQLWLGYGFDWGPKHAQRAFELSKRDWSELRGGDKDPDMGVKWLHGIELHEEPIFQPMKHVEGHTLITGTTGSGKTRLFDLLITQRILAGESVIVLDPKGDAETRENMRRACNFMGDPGKFISFHPGFPQESVRLDPLANFSRPTELASRIAALIATSSGGEVFKDFGQMAMNNIIQGLLLVDSRPSLTRLRRYLEGGTEYLVLAAVSNYIERQASDFQRDFQEVQTRNEKASALKRAAAAVRFYREFVQPEKPNSDLEGLLTMFEHDKAHFSKMVASLLPIMNMLTSGDLGPMLSPDRTDQNDERPIYDTRKITELHKVAYIGLDSLTDGMVGSAIGSMVLSDLAAVAGDRYNYGKDLQPINIFVDECAEVINDPLIQLLNKGRGAKLRLFVATQTIADFEARLGDAAKATQVLGNINNNISLRVIDPDTQKYITDNLPLTRVKYVMRTQGMSSDSSDPAMYGGNHGERLMEEESPLLQPQLLGYLPNLEYIAKISGGRVVKGRLPILVESKESEAV